MHYLSYVLVYHGGNNHLNIWRVWSTWRFSSVINSRKGLFSFLGQFCLVTGSLIPFFYQTDGETSTPTTTGNRCTCKSQLLQNGQPCTFWGREKTWMVLGSFMKQSIIYLPFLQSTWKVLWNGRCDHFKGISLLTLSKSILNVAVVHKICSKVLKTTGEINVFALV